ncbi:MAG TPA: 16S rRNA processing protein RimM [Clostridiales bacterium]|jgi:16S rRNA processing protein RimM|nr:16S rRNA processing protein RimM [Clostridiales bacterium]
MTEPRLLPAGTIVTTHGVRGEVKLRPVTDSAEFLLSLSVFYMDSKPVKPSKMRVHKGMLLMLLPGIDSVDAAMPLIGKTVYFNKNDKKLPENTYFISDLIGLSVFDTRTDRILGEITDVLQPPAHDVYVVSDGKNEIMIPAVPEFILSVELEQGRMVVKTIEGMGDDAAD